jgi:hypothetical protein
MTERPLPKPNARNRQLRLFVMLAILFAGGIAAALLSRRGSPCGSATACAGDCRTVDAELIKRAVTHEAARLGIQSDHASVVEFIAEHPACCSVARPRGTQVGIARTPEYDDFVQVHLKFSIPANQRSSYELPYYDMRVEFDRCGSLGDTYGEQVKSIADRP